MLEMKFRIYFTLSETGQAKDYAVAVNKLIEYFSPKVNIAYKTYIFREATQKAVELLDAYHTRLRQLAATCQFTDIDKEIKTVIIQTCTSSKLCRQPLQYPDLTLTELLAMGRAMAVAEVQAAGIVSISVCAANFQDVMAVSSASNLVKKSCFNCA